MGIFVYMVQCGDGSYYTGWTDNLEKRLLAHQEGKGAKYTRGRGPIQMMWHEEVADKSTALKREIEIKKWSRLRKQKFLAESKGVEID